ncbi:hypothetical protein PR202_ga03550 [Eleusine coracana subsp. coracana]|uniref:Uncharacterized protein n=1 Tax=Eleusine coracana subsp. coracana TaxID=191504 RepID=A0AAV5BMN2_ELECO|nr:hypothetical protein PR202_ga03550 [Eleusine coracana subsp. coracana]
MGIDSITYKLRSDALATGRAKLHVLAIGKAELHAHAASASVFASAFALACSCPPGEAELVEHREDGAEEPRNCRKNQLLP